MVWGRRKAQCVFRISFPDLCTLLSWRPGTGTGTGTLRAVVSPGRTLRYEEKIVYVLH